MSAALRFRFVDLFSGLGGFHVALHELGGEGVFAAEWEPTLNALYKENFDIQPWFDINTLDSDEVIAEEVPDHDLLAAGFPCQPFSKAGDQLGFKDTTQGHLFFKVFKMHDKVAALEKLARHIGLYDSETSTVVTIERSYAR